MKKVFIDGKAGTTGLRIFDRLSARDDIELIVLSEEDRKNPECRKKAINSADVAFLCLPDDAARESVSFVENPETVIIDTSTAHRTNPDWAYGFPELSKAHEEKLLSSKRIAVPGCHASGFIALVYPLVEAGFISKDTLLTCFSVTGYSGGGKNMIAAYESENREKLLDAPRQYALTQQHKHLKEMVGVTGINSAPVFCPVVSDFYSGMEVTVPLFSSQLINGKTKADIENLYKEKYADSFVKYEENTDESGFISSNALSFKDNMQISVHGNDERILLVARYDNLGKGASGAAIECMNIAIGADRTSGLSL
ncbi:MAG: N-acetyl-gamma-glutamyl-phosphate reductase [Clostridia bacterium]|nr:N-acetyl-gamma-glutamyl-phosphate reductase [Clostridia bacterium]MBR3975608.1 N-acetyl-gamma-glutamyl-phosphate reductase [Clostridia bacterium]